MAELTEASIDLGLVKETRFYLGHVDVDCGQKLSQMFRIVVPKDVTLDSAVTDPLNHGSVVASVGENFATCEKNALIKPVGDWAVVVAQLVERSLPIPEVRGSNPVIGKNLFIY